MGTGNVGSRTASTHTGSVWAAWASVAVTGVDEPIVTGVGGMQVTYLLLVLCLLPVRAQKHLL